MILGREDTFSDKSFFPPQTPPIFSVCLGAQIAAPACNRLRTPPKKVRPVPFWASSFLTRKLEKGLFRRTSCPLPLMAGCIGKGADVLCLCVGWFVFNRSEREDAKGFGVPCFASPSILLCVLCVLCGLFCESVRCLLCRCPTMYFRLKNCRYRIDCAGCTEPICFTGVLRRF